MKFQTQNTALGYYTTSTAFDVMTRFVDLQQQLQAMENAGKR